MNSPFLSLKEAESYTGKSRSTLRRFVTSVTKPENHPDRDLVKPTVEEVDRLHAENHPFSWKVSHVLLDRSFDKKPSLENGLPEANSDLRSNELLKRTLSMLETELSEKNKQIAEFQERQRETNILLRQANERVALLSNNDSQSTEAEDLPKVDQSNPKPSPVGIAKASPAGRPTIWDKLSTPLFGRR